MLIVLSGTFGQERKKTNGTGNQGRETAGVCGQTGCSSPFLSSLCLGGNEKSLEAEGVLSADKELICADAHLKLSRLRHA